MGQKDMTEKLLEDYNDVFADIYNIPVRVLGYDYAKYRRQVDEKRFPLLPVITLVLNMSDRRWSGCKSLADIMKIPVEFEPFFQDYKVMVVDVAFLEDDVIERFTSDFKLVAKFFKNRRLGVEPLGDDSEIKHVTELIDFISVFANDADYIKTKSILKNVKERGERVTMCYVAQGLIKKGANKMAKLVTYLLENNMTDELQTALSDEEAWEEMYEKYGIEVAS